MLQQRMQRSLEFIQEGLHGPLPLAEVAKVAALSPHHFHRLFRSVMGETLGNYVTRQRMELATLMLAYHQQRSITDIGFSCGYSSTANFSKAYSKYFGVSPSSVRSPGTNTPATIGTLVERHGKSFQPSDLFAAIPRQDLPHDESRLEVLHQSMRFENREAQSLVSMTAMVSYDIDLGISLWQELVRRVISAGLCTTIDPYGVLHDDPAMTPKRICRYDAGIATGDFDTELGPPLFRTTIAAGRYAIFRYQGQVTEAEAVYRDIYSLWFPNSGLVPAVDPPIEHYLDHGPTKDHYIDMELMFRIAD